MSVIYLDYNASTPVSPQVFDAMAPYFTDSFANASSTDHGPGHQARKAVERARGQVAELIGAEVEEVTFTSGATEANNLALFGIMGRAAPDAEVVVSAIEHPAILEPARRFGGRLTIAPVDGDGFVDPDALRSCMSPRTALVCVMAANNETGAIQPLPEVAHICREAEVPLHIDAAQLAGRLPVDVDDLGAATLAISGHKMYGPKGIGVLFVRRRPPRTRIAPTTFGGGQERDLRPGSLNVPGIVGLGEAAALAAADGADQSERELAMRASLLQDLSAIAPTGFAINSPATSHLPQTINCRFAGVSASGILRSISDRVALATGSACSTTSVEPSHVLLAQGLSEEEIAESLRVSFGRRTTPTELSEFVATLKPVLEELSLLTAA